LKLLPRAVFLEELMVPAGPTGDFQKLPRMPKTNKKRDGRKEVKRPIPLSKTELLNNKTSKT
jgi:hypothetical protein